MKKRLLALFLAFVMAMSLLPVSVFADGGTDGQPQGTKNNPITANSNGVTVNKYVSGDEESGYQLTLEAYASNRLNTTTTTTPLDIVLVLDVSGSMDEVLTDAQTKYQPVYEIDERKDYFIWDKYQYRRVEHTDAYPTEKWVWDGFLEGHWETVNHPAGWIYGYKSNPTYVEPMTSAEDIATGHTQFYTAESTQSVTKMEALQRAVNRFIDQVDTKNNSVATESQHRISLVKFADDSYYQDNYDSIGDNHLNESDYNYTQVVKDFTSAADDLKAAVNKLDAGGATAADYGLELANHVFNGDGNLTGARSNAKKVLVFFTDGEPNHSNGFSGRVAAEAVTTAKTLKANGRVRVYTVGVFEEETNDISQYMNGVSSNYPNASAETGWYYFEYGNKNTDGVEYYALAENAEDLNSIFKGIADSVTTGTLTANPDADSVLSDKLSGYFAFPAGMSSARVEVKYAPATDYNLATETFIFGEAGALPEGAGAPEPVITGDTITIKGFNYKNYAATYDSANSNPVSGGKLVVTFPIVAKQSCTTWQAGVHNYKTNDAASLTYKMNEGRKGSTNLVDPSNPEEVLSPTAPVTAYTVTYNTGVVTAVTDNRAYISGQTATVKAAPEYEGHTFNGWETGDKTYEEGDTFVVTGNVALTAKWTEDVAPTPDPDWDVSRSKTAENLVKQNDGSYTSDVTLSLPSAQEQLVSDVVFVLDKSTSAEVETSMIGMLNGLNSQVKNTGAQVKVGVVIFNKVANRVQKLTQLNDKTLPEIENAIKTQIGTGTNIHAGLLAGKSMLDGDQDVANNRKYLILVTDGITYLYSKDGDYNQAYTRSVHNGDGVPQDALSAWTVKYKDGEGYTFIPSNWGDWLNNIRSTTDRYAEYDHKVGENPGKVMDLAQDPNVITNVEHAMLQAYDLYQELSSAYNCYTVPAGGRHFPAFDAFIKYMAGDASVDFTAIQNDIYYLLSAGSKVVDVIGNNFDFVNNASNLTMKVGDTTLTATSINARDGATATYAFGAANGSKDKQDYPYVVSYYQNGKGGSGECFVWEINVDVSNFAPVQLIYKVKLVNAPTDPGTYELPTNESATLYPKDSNGLPGKGQEFEKPTVSYTDEKEDGGGTPGTTNDYTLHYVTNGGNHLSPESESDKWTKDYEDLPTPVRNGYTFEGWYWDSHLTESVTGDVRVNEHNVNIYAKWSEKIGPDDTGVSNWLDTKDHRLYLVGYPDSTFRADRNMTRAEVAQMFYALLLDKNVTITKSFSDVPDDAWYATAVKTLASLGMMDGYPDGTFRPDEPITRAEFATVGLAFAYDPLDASCSYYDVGANAWYHTYVAQATTYGWIGGYPDNTFRPGNDITRVEVCVIVNNMLGRDADERYIDRHEDELVHFVDLSDSYWGYYTIMESTNTHEYTGSFTNEKWTDVK